MEKRAVLFLMASLLLMQIAAATTLEVQKESVEGVVVTELVKNAKFNLIIKNLGETDSFEFYTLVGNVDLLPKGFITIEGGETKIIPLTVIVDERVRKNYGDYSFAFNIRGQASGITEEKLTIKLARFKESFKISAEDITLDSSEAVFTIENLENYSFENLKVEISSNLVAQTQEISLKPYESVQIKIPLDKEKVRGMTAGTYLATIKLSKDSAKEIYEANIRYLERTGTATKEEGAGFFVISKVIEKKNEGNVIAPVEIAVKKDIISRLFTTFSKTPDKIERKGLVIAYAWRQELKPGESLRVVINTNWLIPMALLLVIIIAALVIKITLTRDLKLKKEISFVKTKGGEFALKVTLKAKASRFVEKIVIIDRLPPLVKLYERFGPIPPQKIDEKTRRMEWQFESLQPGEERILTYLVYSKISVVGKYELPTAMAVYERDGKIHESQSNKVFFLAEQVLTKKEEE